MIGLLAFTAVFAAALVYFQYFAFYDRQSGGDRLEIAGQSFDVSGLDRIDASSSPLKLRACFIADPEAFSGLALEPRATPLNPPPWFGCFDAGALTADLASGDAEARLIATDSPTGFDVVAAIYPDGRGYVWRQLGAAFSD